MGESFHKTFAEALQHPTTDPATLLQPVEDGDHRRRFDVYRNNRMMSLIETLHNTYPVLSQLVGDEFFKAAASAFIDRNPPVQPVMAEYGGEFGTFVASLPNTEKLPYLKDIAELEWWLLQAYHCADMPILQLTALAEIAPDSMMDLRLACHPALHGVGSQWPIGGIWTLCTEGSGADFEAHKKVDMLEGEFVIITRPEMNVLVNKITESAFVFLNAIQNGSTLGDAADQGLSCDKEFNAGEHLSGLVSLGAFSGVIEV